MRHFHARARCSEAAFSTSVERSTSFLNTSPRCSKLSNMSKDAQAGESRTTSPGARPGAGRGRPRPGSDAARATGMPARRERGADPRRVLADEDRVADAPARGRGQRRPVLALALAARDQHDGLREALERLEGRVDVGALRVVVVLSRRPDRARTRSGARRRGSGRWPGGSSGGETPEPERAGGGGQDVLDVVLAAQADLGQRADLLDVAVEPRHDPAVTDEDAVGELAPPAEPDARRARCARPARAAAGSSALSTAQSVGRLVAEDPGLGVRDRPRTSVAIEVVGRDVEHGGDPRLEALDGLELEARHLGTRPGRRPGTERVRGRAACRCCRRPAPGAAAAARSAPVSAVVVVLPFVPVMAIGLGLARPPAELELADDRHRRGAGGSELRARRAARRGSPPPARRGRTRPGTRAGDEPHARGRPSARHLASERDRGAWRPPPTTSAPDRSQEARRGDPLLASPTTVTRRPPATKPRASASPIPRHRRSHRRLRSHRAITPSHPHRSFRVVRASSASANETIQKRTTIFGSAQPLSS